MYPTKKPQAYTNTNTKASEISHFGHPKHNLYFEYSQFPFKCDGCKEIGIGSRYKCSKCDYDLHMHCALPSATIHHPFYPKCSFHFHSYPPGDIPRYCNACEKGIMGFSYHCPSCDFDLHPCCAKLPMMIDDGEMKMYLCEKVSEACGRCGKKGRSWSYRSKCRRYSVHVACVREMVVESWPEMCYGGRREGSYYGLKNTIQSGKKSRGKVMKYCEMAGMAVQFVVSAVLGDPTVLIGGIVGSLISRA